MAALEARYPFPVTCRFAQQFIGTIWVRFGAILTISGLPVRFRNCLLSGNHLRWKHYEFR